MDTNRLNRVRAFADFSTDGDWVVTLDGVRMARFTKFDRNSAYWAARKAQEIRRVLAENATKA